MNYCTMDLKLIIVTAVFVWVKLFEWDEELYVVCILVFVCLTLYASVSGAFACDYHRWVACCCLPAFPFLA